MSNFHIVLVGCGSLGLKYLEGINLVRNIKIKIYIYDIDSSQLKRIKESIYNNITIQKCSQFKQLPSHSEILIISTTAKNRSNLIVKLNKKLTSKYIIIEKILEQNVNGLVKIKNELSNHENCYVNTPRRVLPIYKKLKSLVSSQRIVLFERLGGRWGMLGNSIHYIDLCSWLTDSKIYSVNFQIDENNKYQTGRKGFFDYDGHIEVNYLNSTKLSLSSDNNTSFNGIKILLDNNIVATVHENTQQIIYNGKKYNIFKKYSHQELTKIMVEKIKNKKNIGLTSLDESLTQHFKLINNFFYSVT